LEKIAAAWPSLTAAICRAILALIRQDAPRRQRRRRVAGPLALSRGFRFRVNRRSN
jgi:hypothetical protein